MVAQKSELLLRRVLRRLHLMAYAKGWYFSMLVLGGLYAIVLLVSRLTGLIPDIFVPMTLLVIPAAALLVAFVFYRRPGSQDAARAADEYGATKDLFLTVTEIDKTPGEYQSIVIHDAEQKAERIQPVSVVPLHGSKKLWNVVGLLCVLALAALYFPQFDPFGNVAQAKESQEAEKRLLASKKATEMRIEKLISEKPAERQSEEVKKAIEDLKATFKKMKPNERHLNFKKLAKNQQDLGKKYQKLNSKKLSNVLNKNEMNQKFGASNKKLEQWQKEFKEGSTKSLQKELSELKQELKELAETKDPVKQAELQKKMQKKLQDMKKFAETNFDSPQLNQAIKRAQEQLGMASKGASGSAKSMESLSSSADLIEMELKELALNAKDLKALEEALQTLQMAKLLNNQGQLDGKQCEEMKAMQEYNKLYAKLCQGGMCQGKGCKMCAAGMCMGQGGKGAGRGGGMGGPGQGQGGPAAPEDDSTVSNFKTERVRTTVTAGKMLMSMKVKGLGELNEGQENYEEAVQQVKQGVSEALNSEQVPPGYHEGVKKYFDNLQKEDSTQ